MTLILGVVQLPLFGGVARRLAPVQAWSVQLQLHAPLLDFGNIFLHAVALLMKMAACVHALAPERLSWRSRFHNVRIANDAS
jgi:hypothetical protein